MTDYFIDKRATGANDGDPDGATGADANGIYQDAWQSVADEAMLANPTDTLTFVAGSSTFQDPYVITTGWDGGGNNKTIIGNGNFISGEIDLNGSAYKWTQSAANTNEYYIEAAGGGDPSITTVTCGSINGKFQETAAEEATYEMDAPGSLANNHIGYGNNDTLGFNTVYARYDSGNLADIVVKVSQVNYILDDVFENKTTRGLRFMYASIGGARIKNAAQTATLEDCQAIFCASASGGHGFEFDNAGAKVLKFCLGFFAGHRFFNVSAADSGNVTIQNCVDINSHLFGIINATYAATLTIQNCIGYNEPAGILDTNANALMTLDENFNFWYPSLASGTSMEYSDGTDNIWTATGANSVPAALNTDTSTLAAIEAGGGSDPSFTNIDLEDYESCDFSLSSDSPCIGIGERWWTGAEPVGSSGEPFSDMDTDMGISQSTHGSLHPVNL